MDVVLARRGEQAEGENLQRFYLDKKKLWRTKTFSGKNNKEKKIPKEFLPRNYRRKFFYEAPYKKDIVEDDEVAS